MYTGEQNLHVTCSVGECFEKLVSNPENRSAQSKVMGNGDKKQDSMTQLCITSLGKQYVTHRQSTKKQVLLKKTIEDKLQGFLQY